MSSIHLFFWRVFITVYWILGWQLLPFCTLKMLFHYFIASIISVDKSSVWLLFPFQEQCLFLLAAFMIFTLYFVSSRLILFIRIICFVFYLVFIELLESVASGFISFRKFLAFISPNMASILFSFLRETLSIHIVELVAMLHMSLSFFLYFPSFYVCASV